MTAVYSKEVKIGALLLALSMLSAPIMMLAVPSTGAIKQPENQPTIDLTAIPHPYSIELVWSKVPDDSRYGNYALNLTRYDDIMMYDASNVPTIVQLPLNATSYTDSNITTGSIYYYQIDILSNSPNHNYRNAGSYQIHIKSTATTPEAPTIVRVEPEDGGAFLAFSIPWNDGGASIVNFTVFSGRGRSDLGPLTNIGVSEIYYNGGCHVLGLDNGIDYYLAVKSVNLVGPSNYSSIFQVKPLPSPSSFKATAQDDGTGIITINVTWQTPRAGFGNVTGYVLTETGLTAFPRDYSFTPEQRNYSLVKYFFGGSASYRVTTLYEDGNASYSNTTVLGPFAMYEGSSDDGYLFTALTIVSISIPALGGGLMWCRYKEERQKRSK